MCVSDVEENIYMIILKLNGVVVEGNVIFFWKYFVNCNEVIFMCVSENVLYVLYKGDFGGVIVINTFNRVVEMVVENGSV